MKLLGKHIVINEHSVIDKDVVVGDYAVIEPFTYVKEHVLPFTVVRGNPAKWYTINYDGLRDSGAREKDIDALLRAYADLPNISPIQVQIENEYMQKVFNEWVMGILDNDLSFTIAFDGQTVMVGDMRDSDHGARHVIP